MKNEIRDIKGYEGLYTIDTNGVVTRLERTVVDKDGNEIVKEAYEPKQFKGGGKSGLYTQVNLVNKKGTRKTYNIHQLMAITFIGERPNGYQTLHADDNKDNNHISNLSYDLPSRNRIDSFKNNTEKMDMVMEIRQRGDNGENKQALADKFGMSKRSISEIVARRSYKFVNEDGSIDDSTTAIKYISTEYFLN